MRRHAHNALYGSPFTSRASCIPIGFRGVQSLGNTLPNILEFHSPVSFPNVTDIPLFGPSSQGTELSILGEELMICQPRQSR